jgi:hypothetical protein
MLDQQSPASNTLEMVYGKTESSLPSKVFQPLNVAIVLSAGLHVVLGYSAPAVPFLKRPQAPREVKVIQLSPQEQGRIRRDTPVRPPAVSGVPLPPPPGSFPNTPSLPGGFTTLPRPGIVGTPVPDEGDNDVPNFSRFIFPRRNSVVIDPDVGFVPPPEFNPPRVVPTLPPSPPARRADQFTQSDNLTTADRGIRIGGVPQISPTPSPTNSPLVEPSATPSPTSSPTPNPTPTLPVLPPIPEELARVLADPDSSRETKVTAFLRLAGWQGSDLPRVERLNLEVPYPRAACLVQVDGTTELMVRTKDDGAIATGPALITSAGAKALDDAAIAAVRDYRTFAPETFYAITVPFTYKAADCSPASTLPIGPGSLPNDSSPSSPSSPPGNALPSSPSVN